LTFTDNSEALVTAFDTAQLMDVAAQVLPQLESVAEFRIWCHDGHFGGHFQQSFLSAQPSTDLAALSLGILVSLSGIFPLIDVGPAPGW
jgi:hypothetical protein